MSIFSNQESDRKSIEQALEIIRADYEQQKQEIAQRDQEIVRLKERIAQLEAQSQGEQSQETPTPQCECEQEPKPSIVPDAQSIDYTKALEALTASIGELKAQQDELKTLIGHRDIQDENMRAMHKELERYKGDFFAKVTQPYLVALLDLHRRFFDTYSHFDQLDNTATDMTELYKNLLNEFKSAVDALSNQVYNDFGVEYFTPEENEEFNPKAHKPFNVIPATTPEQNRRIAKTYYGGFRDVDTQKIIRPARVACYKWEEPTE